jgi:hypothetical protein
MNGYWVFQWAPTLGGECYAEERLRLSDACFNGHPPLGVNATRKRCSSALATGGTSFNGHPPLGVNATNVLSPGGTMPYRRFNGHPPLGVNATV